MACVVDFVTCFHSSCFHLRSWHVPDETWQCVEISHLLAFGSGHATWEWQTAAAIRSHLHPLFFVPSQLMGHWLGHYLGGGEEAARYLVILLPRVAQAVLSAVGDVCASAFCLRHFGARSHSYFLVTYATSWFLNYCLSRTLVNSFETALTSMALALYPTTKEQRREPFRVLYALLVSLCFVIRPTSALLWILPVISHLWHSMLEGGWKSIALHGATALTTLCSTCAIDSVLYGEATFAPWNFFSHNVLNDVGSFYGVHRWHWYLTSGLPVVLGAYGVPPLALGLRRSWSHPQVGIFAKSIALSVTFLSLVPHKEFRFLLPLLPLCWCLASDYLRCRLSSTSPRLLLTVTAAAFVPACAYLSPVHHSGTVPEGGRLLIGRVADCEGRGVCRLLFL